MNKGIIVVNMPEKCNNCPFIVKDMRLITGLCAIWENLHDDMRFISPDSQKPDWCPVKVIPSKCRPSPGIDYIDGWNDCIDKIIDG